LTIRYLFATLPFRDSSDNNSRVTELGLSPCLLKYSLNLELSETMEMALLLRWAMGSAGTSHRNPRDQRGISL